MFKKLVKNTLLVTESILLLLGITYFLVNYKKESRSIFNSVKEGDATLRCVKQNSIQTIQKDRITQYKGSEWKVDNTWLHDCIIYTNKYTKKEQRL